MKTKMERKTLSIILLLLGLIIIVYCKISNHLSYGLVGLILVVISFYPWTRNLKRNEQGLIAGIGGLVFIIFGLMSNDWKNHAFGLSLIVISLFYRKYPKKEPGGIPGLVTGVVIGIIYIVFGLMNNARMWYIFGVSVILLSLLLFISISLLQLKHSKR